MRCRFIRSLVFSALFILPSPGAVRAQGGQGAYTWESLPDPVNVPSMPLLSLVAVNFDPGVSAQAFAQVHGLTIDRQFVGDPHTWVFNAGSVARATQLLPQLQQATGVRFAYQDRIAGYTLGSFTPNDTIFNNPAAPNNFGGQWHLGNNISGANVNVAPAWTRNVTGAGVVIGIVDSGVEGGHEDIAPNFSAANSFNFITGSPTITLNNGTGPSADRHGHAAAGVAAARGGNGIGVTGAAPFATVSTQRVFNGDNSAGTDTMFANATTFNSSGANTNIKIKNHSYGFSGNYQSDTAQVNALITSYNAGTMHTVAAGNNRGFTGEDANRQMFQNSYAAITVAALGRNGVFADYSSYGANVFVTAPSSSSGQLGITTTDRTGSGNGYNGSGDYTSPVDPNHNYTAGFGGTSSAAPLVAGVLALGKEVNPNMETRLAKHILARTSTIVNAGDATATSDGGWRTNAAGFTFNQNYGFGLINADAFTLMAAVMEVTPRVNILSGTQNVAAAIPDNNATGITRTFVNNTSGLIEEVIVNMNITHGARGQLEIYITSPSGYTSRLTRAFSTAGGSNINWNYLTNAFWGEDAQGTWSVNVRDLSGGTTGTWNSFSLTIHTGTIVAIPEPATIAFLGRGLGGAGFAWLRRRPRQAEEQIRADLTSE